jgi:hypothetical protein
VAADAIKLLTVNQKGYFVRFVSFQPGDSVYNACDQQRLS